jgi:hypothetical protein
MACSLRVIWVANLVFCAKPCLYGYSSQNPEMALLRQVQLRPACWFQTGSFACICITSVLLTSRCLPSPGFLFPACVINPPRIQSLMSRSDQMSRLRPCHSTTAHLMSSLPRRGIPPHGRGAPSSLRSVVSPQDCANQTLSSSFRPFHAANGTRRIS